MAGISSGLLKRRNEGTEKTEGRVNSPEQTCSFKPIPKGAAGVLYSVMLLVSCDNKPSTHPGFPPPGILSEIDSSEDHEIITRFVAFGDAGTGSAGQVRVADAVKQVCEVRGCDFVLLLGDDFYPSGVESVEDPKWESHFERPYAELNLPFRPVLGNHDYGGEGMRVDLRRGAAYVQRRLLSPHWDMPFLWYSFTAGPVRFYALDTTCALLGLPTLQAGEIAEAMAHSDSPWNIAYGHHPYLSNGPHGDAGKYEKMPWLPIGDGQGVKEFLEDVVCGTADVYLSGHDHSRQWLRETCRGTELMVSGAGAKATSLPGEHSTWFQANTLGFFWFEADERHLRVAVYNQDGAKEFEGVRQK